MAEMQQAAPAQQGGEGQEQSQVGQLIQNVSKGLMMILQLTKKTEGMDPQIAQRMQAVVDEFGSVIDALTGGGEEQGPPQPPQQAGAVASPESGGNPNARPA